MTELAHPDVYLFDLAIKFINETHESENEIMKPRITYLLTKEAEAGSDHMLILLHKSMICKLMDFYLKSHVLRQRIIITLPKLTEALTIDSGKESQYTEEVDFEEKEYYEDDPKDFNCFDNGCVMKMMTRMGYKLGIGLGCSNQGPSNFNVDIQMRKSTLGLGYRSTHMDDIRHKKVFRERAQARSNNIPFEIPMRPYPSTLNGQFIRAGEFESYWGFREARIVPTGWGIEDDVN